jgi:septal ring factor EnvC (AmiA/AmiB activator)
MKKHLLYCICIVFLFGSGSVLGQPSKQKQLEAQRQVLLKEIKNINSLLFNTRKEEKDVLTQVEDLDTRIQALEKLIKITNQQANYLSRKINENQAKITSLRNELKQLKEDYASMIVKSYKNKSQQNRLLFLLSSQSFLQAYKRFQYMKQYTKYRKKQGIEIQEKTKELQALNNQLAVQKKEKQKLVLENKQAKASLIKEKQQQQDLIASLRKNEGKFSKQIREKQRQINKIDKQIDAIIAAAIAASNKKSGSKTTSKATSFALTAEAKALAADFTNNKGKLPWPVETGLVVKRFGTTRHPQLPNVTTYCSGVEIATDKGAKARAVFTGEVMQIQKLKGANKAVFVQHGDYITVYSNLYDVTVKKGDKVSTKQVLGTVYTHPLTKKTILKFLVYKNATKLNPADWVYKM